MERWKYLPEGAVALVNEDALKNATMRQLEKLAVEIEDMVEEEHKLKESMVDLDRLKWPASIYVRTKKGRDIGPLSSLIDRQGRYYLRYQDFKAEFVPGDILWKEGAEEKFTILDISILYLGEEKACVMLTVE